MDMVHEGNICNPREVKLLDYVLELPGEISADVCDELIDTYDTFVSPEHDLVITDGIANDKKAFIPLKKLNTYSSNSHGRIDIEGIVKKYDQWLDDKGLELQLKCINGEMTERFGLCGGADSNDACGGNQLFGGMMCISTSDKFGYQYTSTGVIVILFLNESRDVSGKGDLELAPGLSIEARKGKVVVFPSSWMYAFDDTPFKNIDKYVVYYLLD